jgi:Cdc6-like AAA superfamily ATPase
MGGLFIETVEDRYESIAESQAVDPLATFKRIRNQRSGLRMLGVLRWRDRNRDEGGGRHYEYRLDPDPQIVIEIRQEAASAR